MIAKRFFLLFLITLSLLIQASSVKNVKQSLQKNHKIVIDAGHGGHDPGAIGKNSKEKDITLAIAIKLGEKIKQAYKNVEVIYTRKNDVFVELYKRAKIANENQAELFISIHCNSSKNLLAYGTESWVMGLHKSEENLAVAKKENSAILLEDDYLSKYDGFDPNSPEANAIFSLYQNAYLEQSLIFASLIQKHFRTSLKRCDRGIKQAGFLVLYRTTMPGVLIETGFISNPDEEKYLSSEKGQNNIATAICNAFIEYWANINGINPEDNDIADKFNFIEEIVDKDTTSNKNNTTDVNNIKNNTDIITFKVQFATSSTKKSLNSPEFKDLENVSVYFHQGIYKYTVGDLNNLEDAINLQKEMINKGYKDAFVVAFKNNERISPSEAVKLLKKD